MDLKLTKTTHCSVSAGSRWGKGAAVCMGLSFFLRMVYYFGLRNLNDIPLFEVIFSVVLPLAVSIAFLLAMKLPQLHKSRILCGLGAAWAVNYVLAAKPSVAGVMCDVLVLALGVLVMLACEGYVPQRQWLRWGAAGVLGFRVLIVDLFGYILPLGEWKVISYIPECSNLFALAALAMLALSLRLRKAE